MTRDEVCSTLCFLGCRRSNNGLTGRRRRAVVVPTTPGVCFPSGPSCFSSISDFTTAPACTTSSRLSLALAPSPSFSSVTPRQQTPDNFPWLSAERLLKKLCLADILAPLATPSLDMLAYKIRISNTELPPTPFIIHRSTSSSLFLPTAMLAKTRK